MYDDGSKFICQEDNWYNAYGEEHFGLNVGMRVTVTGSVRVAGTTFLSFKETPEGCFYLCNGFKPMRNLN